MRDVHAVKHCFRRGVQDRNTCGDPARCVGEEGGAKGDARIDVFCRITPVTLVRLLKIAILWHTCVSAIV